jgi:twitching motility protein PilT
MVKIEQLLRGMIDRKASDLHLKAGHPPVLRIHGQLVPQPDWDVPDEAALQEMSDWLMDESQREVFARDLELDFAYELGDEARFRVNAARQRGGLYLTLRAIGRRVPLLAELGLPGVCAQLAMLPRGLVLVTGPAGCGKSTTLAAMVEHVNRTAARRIVTIEEPIEYVFQDQRCVITQREVGTDTHSYAEALKHVLWQDPDVIMVGEMRDLETIAATLTAAETGHLIRESKAPQMVSVMQTGREHGMQTLDQALRDLCRNQQITLDEALMHTSDPENLRRLLRS